MGQTPALRPPFPTFYVMEGYLHLQINRSLVDNGENRFLIAINKCYNELTLYESSLSNNVRFVLSFFLLTTSRNTSRRKDKKNQ